MSAAALRHQLACIAAVLLLGCAPSEPAVAASELVGRTPINPRAADGRHIHLGFGHHPGCFVLAADGKTENVECPDAALLQLHSCPAGLLYATDDGKCACAPADGEGARRVDCKGARP